jgi:hypothetical protein
LNVRRLGGRGRHEHGHGQAVTGDGDALAPSRARPPDLSLTTSRVRRDPPG